MAKPSRLFVLVYVMFMVIFLLHRGTGVSAGPLQSGGGSDEPPWTRVVEAFLMRSLSCCGVRSFGRRSLCFLVPRF